MSRGNPPNLGFEPEICSVGFALGKRDRVVISSTLLLQPERINPELNQKGYNVKSDVWSLGITMVTLRAWTGTLQPWGWDGVCTGGGSNPAVSSGIWWLQPWVDAHHMGLNAECDSSGHEMNYPGHRVVLLPCAHRGISLRGKVAVSRGVQPALPLLLQLLPSRLASLPGDNPSSAPSLPSAPFLHVPAGSWGIHKGLLSPRGSLVPLRLVSQSYLCTMPAPNSSS